VVRGRIGPLRAGRRPRSRQTTCPRAPARSLRTQQRAWAAPPHASPFLSRSSVLERSATWSRPTGQCSTLEPHPESERLRPESWTRHLPLAELIRCSLERR